LSGCSSGTKNEEYRDQNRPHSSVKSPSSNKADIHKFLLFACVTCRCNFVSLARYSSPIPFCQEFIDTSVFIFGHHNIQNIFGGITTASVAETCGAM